MFRNSFVNELWNEVHGFCSQKSTLECWELLQKQSMLFVDQTELWKYTKKETKIGTGKTHIDELMA